jgi:hypothetical protein
LSVHDEGTGTAGICSNCWMHVDSFHEFYVSVSRNYEIESILDEEIIVYELADKDGAEEAGGGGTFDDEDEGKSVKAESIYNEESITEWITEVGPEETEQDMIEMEQDLSLVKKLTNFSDSADDQKIRETANMFCDTCSAPFESLRDARIHYKQAHNISEGYIVCCQRKFKQKCRLVEHVNTHYNFKYPCQQCDKTFDSKAYLTKHMACHETIKQYVSSNLSILTTTATACLFISEM